MKTAKLLAFVLAIELSGSGLANKETGPTCFVASGQTFGAIVLGVIGYVLYKREAQDKALLEAEAKTGLTPIAFLGGALGQTVFAYNNWVECVKNAIFAD